MPVTATPAGTPTLRAARRIPSAFVGAWLVLSALLLLAAAPAAPAAPPLAAVAQQEPPVLMQPAEISFFEFRPATLAVPTGTSVFWTNLDLIEHSVTQGTSPTPGLLFDSGLLAQGQAFTFTFSEPGQYAYFCTKHPSMQGVVSVGDGAAVALLPVPVPESSPADAPPGDAVPAGEEPPG